MKHIFCLEIIPNKASVLPFRKFEHIAEEIWPDVGCPFMKQNVVDCDVDLMTRVIQKQ
jgi:hypothetical protein